MKSTEEIIPQDQIIIYNTDDGKITVDTLVKDETIWLNSHQMWELFEIDRSWIVKHIKNIYESWELEEETTYANFAQVAKDGKKRKMDYYNLDMIISVWYRVNSLRGTQFRMWATTRLKEYLLQWFSLNEEKLKSGKPTEYFDKLQTKLREIRLSERLFYQKIKDIYTTSIDYNPKDDHTVLFFKTVQNKLLRAISEKTAAELVYYRTNSEKPLLGMQSFDKKISSEITKQDVSIAKNYLNEDEIKTLWLIVEQYLAFAESMAQAQIPMKMADWILRLDTVLELNQKNILTHSGKISHELAVQKSEIEYQKFKKQKSLIEKQNSIQELEQDIKHLTII